MADNPKQLLKKLSICRDVIGTKWKSPPKSRGAVPYSFIRYHITAAADIWLSATGDLNPAEPDIIQYSRGFPRGSYQGLAGYRVNENHQDGGCLRLQ